MMMWPAVTLLGFLVLTALVIAMGTQSTARYEAEQRGVAAPRTRSTAPVTARVTRGGDRRPVAPPRLPADGGPPRRAAIGVSGQNQSSAHVQHGAVQGLQQVELRAGPCGSSQRKKYAGRLPLAVVEVAVAALGGQHLLQPHPARPPRARRPPGRRARWPAPPRVAGGPQRRGDRAEPRSTAASSVGGQLGRTRRRPPRAPWSPRSSRPAAPGRRRRCITTLRPSRSSAWMPCVPSWIGLSRLSR